MRRGKMKKIAFYEPWFFLLFGVFHLHRIWGMIDRKSYADFWIGILESRNAFYYGLMIVLAMLCFLGIISFFKNIHHNHWWRWIYILGGSYLLCYKKTVYHGLKKTKTGCTLCLPVPICICWQSPAESYP